MKKVLTIVLLLLQINLPIAAQQIYEVIAAQGNEGEFPDEGYYAASNNFPRNSLVELRNPSNGRNIQIIIVKRLNSPGNVIVLSDEAAQFLEVSKDRPVSLLATSVSTPGLVVVDSIRDLPYSVDPEINPMAEFTDPNALVYSPDTTSSPNTIPGPPVTEQADSRVAEVEEEELPPLILPSREEEETPSSLAKGINGMVNGISDEPSPEPVEPQEVIPEPVSPAESQQIPLKPLVPDEAQEISPELLPPQESVAAEKRQTRGISTAINNLREGSNPVSPAFDLVKTDHVYWPPEFDADAAVGVPEEEAAEPDFTDYADALEHDPTAEWLNRARNRYPDRDLFLPADEAITRTAEEPEDPLDLGNTVSAEEPMETTSDIGFDFTQDLPKADLLASRNPDPSAPLDEGPLPLPENNLREENIQASNTRVPAPPLRQPEPGAIALAQYMDPEPDPEPVSEETTGDVGFDFTQDHLREENIQASTTRIPAPPLKQPEEVIVTLEEAEFRSPDPSESLVVEEPQPAAETEEFVDSSDLLASLEETETPEEAVEETIIESPAATETLTFTPDSHWAEHNLPLVSGLQSNGYYLQVGAFVNPRSAKRVVEEVSTGYPLVVLPVDQEDRKIYRVFVGPLTDDEKGTVLYWFKAKGFQDAFLRSGT